jgi:hypothetical protein
MAIEQQMMSQTAVFSRHADLIREINRHLALSLQASAEHLNLTGELQSLSEDDRLALLQYFLRTVFPELDSELLKKMALEILQRKLLGDKMDRFSAKALQDIVPKTLNHRIYETSII